MNASLFYKSINFLQKFLLKKRTDPKLMNVVYLSLILISPKEFEEKHET